MSEPRLRNPLTLFDLIAQDLELFQKFRVDPLAVLGHNRAKKQSTETWRVFNRQDRSANSNTTRWSNRTRVIYLKVGQHHNAAG